MLKQNVIHKIAILIPCFNEDGNVREIYDQLSKYLNGFDYTILFIDDGSTDNTVYNIKSLSLLTPTVKFISLSRNFGHQNALKAGYDYCKDYDCVISIDADLQHPPDIIPQMVKKWESGFEIINTVRKNQNSAPLLKKVLAKSFYKFINLISKSRIIPNSPDFRLLDKKVVQVISLINESNFFMRELIPWMGFKQTIVSFEVNNRHSGKSKYHLKKQVSFSLKGIVSSSVSPLRLSMLLGVFFGTLSFLYGFYAIYIHLFTVNSIPGWTSVIASILFIAGLQFFLLGIIGEYLGKTFLESRKRPLYLVSETNCDQKNKPYNYHDLINHDNPH